MKRQSNFNDLIEALREHHQPKDDAGLTVREISERVGYGREWVIKRLREAKDRGALNVGRRADTTIDGRATKVPVYMFKRGRA